MGEISEMMLDGTLCNCCGDFLGHGEGFPAMCAACSANSREAKPVPAKVPCPICKKKVKVTGLADRTRDVHKRHLIEERK